MRKFRVEELAKKRGLTQEELTSRVRQQGVEVSLGTIQGIWQNRPRRYRADTLFALAKVLGVPVEGLYTDENSSYTGEHRQTSSLAAEPALG